MPGAFLISHVKHQLVTNNNEWDPGYAATSSSHYLAPVGKGQKVKGSDS